jgi:DNA-binding transcriptional regulator YiaG
VFLLTPLEFKQHRQRLGLSQAGLAALWNMGANGGRTVRRWESGERPINPIAVRLILFEASSSDSPWTHHSLDRAGIAPAE